MSQTKKTQVAVIGGGPGGYAAAFKAADLGLQVTLVDAETRLGGTCLLRGCIPSKALLHTARILTEAKEADHWGIEFGEPKITLEKLQSSTEAVIRKMSNGLDQLCKARRVTYIRGRATFIDDASVRVEGENDDGVVEFEHAVIATGSSVLELKNLIVGSPRVMTSTEALLVPDVPEKLLVIGGGYIGLELGTVYAALGSSVTVVEMTPGLLPGVDRDLVRPLAKRLESAFDSIQLETKVESMEDNGDAIEVVLSGKDNDGRTEKFDKVLVCVGRRPNTDGLGLQNTSVKVSDNGFVQVDEQRRTTAPAIFAIGDVAGQPMLAHKATHEGIVAAEVISGKRVAYDPKAVPAVVFTDPEIAWCGLTEEEAEAEGMDVNVSRFPWAASGRATTLNRNEGVTKLVTEPETNRVLGVGLCGVGAGELVAEGTLAVEMGATAEDLLLTIHPHPTLSETLMEAAELIYGPSTHYKGRSR